MPLEPEVGLRGSNQRSSKHEAEDGGGIPETTV